MLKSVFTLRKADIYTFFGLIWVSSVYRSLPLNLWRLYTKDNCLYSCNIRNSGKYMYHGTSLSEWEFELIKRWLLKLRKVYSFLWRVVPWPRDWLTQNSQFYQLKCSLGEWWSVESIVCLCLKRCYKILSRSTQLTTHMNGYSPHKLPYLSFLVPVKNEFVTTISPAVHLK